MLAGLLYPHLAPGDFGRLCLTCTALQTFARGHSEFQAIVQEAKLGARILELVQKLDKHERHYVEDLSEQKTSLTVSLESHCLALLLNDRQRAWRGNDLARLVLIYDCILSSATDVHGARWGRWQVSFRAQTAEFIPLLEGWRILDAQVKLNLIQLSWCGPGATREHSVLELLTSDLLFNDFKNSTAP